MRIRLHIPNTDVCRCKYSLVKFVPRAAATGGLFWDRSRKFKLLSDDEDDTLAGNPSPNFLTMPKDGHLMSDLEYTRESGFEREALLS
ncbi:hypothetical protein AVEN_220844-1 [Araneus ventricosus]|uniref:Uncharacterized protein n=1 Tax=Araneus ventricosus TaxID=182803 RepID=A0A4Y2QTS5_ARAVE|nr:hypothetical protein AVEN_220844-1 [Araneus ventricosus]